MKKEEDFVMGLSIYMACLREKKTVFHGEELSRCLELVQVLLRYGGDSLCLY